MSQSPTISESDILADVIGLDEGDLSPDVAKVLLQWRFSRRAVDRMNELAERNADGTITQVEKDQLERYLRVGSLINILQAKAQIN